MGWFSLNAAVMQTDGFGYLKESCPHVLTELLEYVARINEHSIAMGKQGNEGALDGSDVNGRRVKQRILWVASGLQKLPVRPRDERETSLGLSSSFRDN